MTAKAYSYDFRQKVMQAIELDRLKKCEASELFNISRNTINLWFQRKAETGDVEVKPRTARAQQKITDWEKFRAFAKEHEDKTQAQMAQLWERDISSRTISRALQKLGLTRKKRCTGIGNGMQRNAPNFNNPQETPKHRLWSMLMNQG